MSMSVKRTVVATVVALAAIAGLVPLIHSASAQVTAAATRPAAIENVLGLKLTDVRGNTITIGHTSRPVALIFLSTECPIANKMIPTLNDLAGSAKEKNVEFYGIIADPLATREEAAKHSTDFKINFPVIFDSSLLLAHALQPTHTPHAFVLSNSGQKLYHGRINDAFVAVGKPRDRITENNLQDAITAAATGKLPTVSSAPPIGCRFELPAATAKTTVTWSRDIAPIVYANCVSCHREGEVAPFSLLTYKDNAKRAQMLADVTHSKQMPPWKSADPWGTFHDQRRLSAAQIALMKQWADAGAPEGDPKDAPPAPKFTDGWQLGEPDMIVKMPKPFTVPAKGRDVMAYVVIPLDLAADKHLVGFEYKPGNRRVVHHMIGLLDHRGNARRIAFDKGDGNSYTNFGGPGFLPTGGIGGWAPGATPRFLPDGIARPVKKGSDLVMQIHYHPTGKEETDQGQIALYFAKKPITHVAINFPLSNRQIDIKPGDNNYIRTRAITTPADVTLFGITPHMHNIGREMKVTATLPDGTTQQLIYIDDWDWNWQDQYQLVEPVKLPRGTKVEMWARFDNSPTNPRNPQDPPKRVTFGEQTGNEMCIAFLNITVDAMKAPLLNDAGEGVQAPDPKKIREALQRLRRPE